MGRAEIGAWARRFRRRLLLKNLWVRGAIGLLAIAAVLGPFAIYAPIGVNAICAKQGNSKIAWCLISTIDLYVVMLLVSSQVYWWVLFAHKKGKGS
jgi:hypothetical protein